MDWTSLSLSKVNLTIYWVFGIRGEKNQPGDLKGYVVQGTYWRDAGRRDGWPSLVGLRGRAQKFGESVAAEIDHWPNV